MTKSSLGLLAIALWATASCAQYTAIEADPCTSAERPITLDNLMQNSLTQSYERCLAVIRDIAANELRK